VAGPIEQLPLRAAEFGSAGEALAAAQACFDRGEHDVALDLWAQIRGLHPSEADAYVQPALALAGVGRTGDADVLLAEGQNQLPEARIFPIARARFACQSGDLVAAAALYARLRITAPDEIVAYSEGAACLRELGRFAVANGVLSEALARFPGVPALAIQYAELAEEQGDWPEAQRRWREARDGFGDEPAAHFGLSRTLSVLGFRDEAEAVLDEAVMALPADAELAVARAWAAEHRDPQETLRRLEAAATRFPDDAAPLFGRGALLRELGDVDTADAVLADALQRFPAHPDVMINYARVAERRNDWHQAAERWAQLSAAYPELVEGHLARVAALTMAGRDGEAAAALADAERRFQLNPEVLAEAAQMAYRQRDWQRAIDNWVTLRERYPDRMDAYAELGVALRELGRFDDAEELLLAAGGLFPDNADIAINYAWVAHARDDLPEALRRWDDVLARFPNDPSPWFGKGAVLRELARFDEADAIFAEALHRFPDHQDVLVNYARVAQARGDWGEALLRWETVYSHFPDLPEAEAGRTMALSALDREAVSGMGSSPPLPAERQQDAVTPEAAFESFDRGSSASAASWENSVLPEGEDPVAPSAAPVQDHASSPPRSEEDPSMEPAGAGASPEERIFPRWAAQAPRQIASVAPPNHEPPPAAPVAVPAAGADAVASDDAGVGPTDRDNALDESGKPPSGNRHAIGNLVRRLLSR
jgi:tetratricopeptide (TPR) repeat protein